jgi:hypothetical protein
MQPVITFTVEKPRLDALEPRRTTFSLIIASEQIARLMAAARLALRDPIGVLTNGLPSGPEDQAPDKL